MKNNFDNIYSFLTLIAINIILQYIQIVSPETNDESSGIKSRTVDLASLITKPDDFVDDDVTIIANQGLSTVDLATRIQETDVKMKSLPGRLFPIRESPKLSTRGEPSLIQICNAMKLNWGNDAPDEPAFKKVCEKAATQDLVLGKFADFMQGRGMTRAPPKKPPLINQHRTF